MKTARLFTVTGSVILFVTGCLHATGYSQVVLAGLAKQSVDPVVAGVLKAGWFTLSGEMLALAIIAFFASSMERGARIVLVCAVASAANAFLLLYFLGPFIGVYITAAVTLIFLVGGALQTKAASPSS
jgi:peptidoglycan/LPS O-acetylase OafA/YrhL